MRALVCSWTVTRGSCRSFQASWLVPESTANTCSAPLLEQHVRKASGRAADIHGRHASRVEPEMIDRMGQLDSPARNPRMIAPAHIQRRISRQAVAWFCQLGLTTEYQSGQHQRLRAGAAFNKATIDQQLVNARLGRFG